MGVVYKINLPSGEFYIGCTSQLLKKRLASHLSLQEVARWNIKLYDSGFNLKTLIDNTDILFSGCGFRQKEIEFIYDNRESDNILNSVIPHIDPRDSKPIPDNQQRFKVDGSNRVKINISLSIEAYKKLIEMHGSNFDYYISAMIMEYKYPDSLKRDVNFIKAKPLKIEPHMYSKVGKREGLYRGVIHEGYKYRAVITYGKKRHNLGLFMCNHKAARVYNLSARMIKENKECFINIVDECSCVECESGIFTKLIKKEKITRGE